MWIFEMFSVIGIVYSGLRFLVHLDLYFAACSIHILVIPDF